MSGKAGDVLFYALALMLPLSALLARRIPLRQTAKMALAWVAIFAVGLVIIGQREHLRDAGPSCRRKPASSDVD